MKSSISKNILSVFLLLSMLIAWTLSSINSTSAAEETVIKGYGSNGKFLAPIDPPDPNAIRIYTAQDLWNVRDNLYGSYVLMNDIDLAGFNGGEWEPIGNGAGLNTFFGTFDGQGYIIKNLTIIGDGYSYNGLFGCFSGIAIKNVGMEGTNIDVSSTTSGVYGGGICGFIEPSRALSWTTATIYNCYHNGEISIMANFSAVVSLLDAPGSSAGGICGGARISFGSFFIIENCYNEGDITSLSEINEATAGGILGDCYAHTPLRICNSFNKGIITSSRNAGGACGFIHGTVTIDAFHNMGNVTASAPTSKKDIEITAGGICGYTLINDLRIVNCINTADISSSSLSGRACPAAGGISGLLNSDNTLIENCLSSGTVSVSSVSSAMVTCAGGIYGYAYLKENSINNCIVLSNAINAENPFSYLCRRYTIGYDKHNNSNKTNNISLHNIMGDVTDDANRKIAPGEARSMAVYEALGWDFVTVWSIDPNINGGYPYLRSLEVALINQESDNPGDNNSKVTLFPLPGQDKIRYREQTAILGRVVLPVTGLQSEMIRYTCDSDGAADFKTVVQQRLQSNNTNSPFYMYITGKMTGRYTVTVDTVMGGAPAQMEITIIPNIMISDLSDCFVGNKYTLYGTVYSDRLTDDPKDYTFGCSDAGAFSFKPVQVIGRGDDFINVAVDFTCNKAGNHNILLSYGGESTPTSVKVWVWKDYLASLVNTWMINERKYEQAVREQADKKLKSLAGRDTWAIALESATKKLDDKHVTTSIDATLSQEARRYCKIALLDILVSSDVFDREVSNFADIKPNDANMLATRIVTTVLNNLSKFNGTREYENGRFVIKVYGFQYGSAFEGTLNCTDSRMMYMKTTSAGFSLTINEMNKLISDFIKDMIALEQNAYDIAKREVAKMLTGYSSFFDLFSEKTNEILMELGFGDVNTTLRSAFEYYNYVKRIFTLTGNDDLLDWSAGLLKTPDDVVFNDGTITDVIVKRAYDVFKDSKDQLRYAVYHYSMNKTDYTDFEKKAFENAPILLLILKCPVDLYVYDMDDNLLGAIEGESISCFSDDIILEKEAEAKKLIVKKGAEVYTRIVSTGYGSLNLSLSEFLNGVFVGRSSFFDIDLYEGKEIFADLFFSSSSGVVNHFSLLYGDEIITADEVLQTDAVKKIEINVKTDGNGFATTGGGYISGDLVTLIAAPDNLFTFIGWYTEGEYLSSDPLYEFIARSDITLTALFMPIPTFLSESDGVNVDMSDDVENDGNSDYDDDNKKWVLIVAVAVLAVAFVCVIFFIKRRSQKKQ